MMLKSTILEALDLTQKLHQALSEDNLDLCRDLLDLRAEAMLRFENAHRMANSQEQAICSSYLRNLFEEDRLLQNTTKDKFSVTQRAVRNNLGSASKVHSGSYYVEPQNACVDRKA